MSWMKRQGGAAPRPDAQAYAAPQPYGNQQNMFPSYQGPLPSQQQSWQMSQQQQQQYNQQYGQVYQQQQPYVNNTNQYYQQPPQQYNQNYVNQNFDQQSYQQNYTHNQPPQQQNFNQNEGHGDAWEDNWGWGWEDSSKHYQNSINQTVPPQPAVQPQAFNNANVIEESFASTNTWNWSMEDKKEPEVPSSMQPLKNNQDEPLHNENLINENNIVLAPPVQGNASNMLVKEKTEEVKSLSDKDVVKEQLPNLALGKRINLENLTPQWSIESQMSQDSSDGPHTQSEGTYRSENQSRNSSKSSPGPNTDATNFNFSHSRLNDMSLTNSEWSKHSNEDSIPISGAQNVNRRESYDELVTSVQEMNIANHENVPLDIQQPSHNIEQVQDKIEPFKAPEPSVSPVSVSQNQIMSQSMPPPPPVSSQHVLNPLQAVNSSLTNTTPLQPLPPINVPSSSQLVTTSLPPPSSVPLLPPTSFQASSNQNPFKSGAPFSHKNIAKAPTSGQPQPFVPHMPNTGLTSPSAVNKVVHQDRLSASFGANLETTPDNSERPDQPQVLSYRSMPAQPQVPDNLEIAPQNDRNEYLQTAHLSSGDYSENTDFSRNIPPPGIRRMGVGQQEVEYNQTLNISGDEPPPGLARMVPGQQTETDNSYNQVVGDDYMDRQIDGQPTDGSGRPYRQAEGQQVADNYAPPTTTRGGDRRPVGLDRMVPGEPSNDEYPQYQSSNFTPANEHRVVTGVDHDYPIPPDSSRSDIREQNVDGSDYTEPPPRNPSRSVIGAREASNVTSPDYSASIDDQQREITMEGENLQDLSVITYDGLTASAADAAKERSHDAADVAEYPPNNSRRQSLNRVTSGEDSERDKAYKASPRKDRDKQKSRDRDRDRERDKDRGRYSRGDRKYDRDPERRRDRGDRERDRRDKEGSPDARRYRRSTRSHRYETEDTDYYSDKERDRRQYREGSYTSSKPPRGDDKDRRYDDRERRRYNTIERERRNDEERGRRGDRRDRHRDRDRFEARYRDIDPRKLTSLRRDRDDDDRRKVVTFSGDAKSDSSKSKGENYSSGSRAGSREATATDEDGEEPRRRTHRDERRRHRHHHYYEGYGMAVPSLEASVAPGGGGAWDEALEAQRRQYEYYERLRRSDPAAYMRVYKQLLHPGLYGASLYDGYGGLGYDGRVEERGSVHSGRSSANGLKAADTYYVRARDTASLRTDCSDRELTTDMSLNLHLEESTVRSERMTPFKYSTAHVKGVLCARALVVVPAAYPADGRAAPLRLLQLQALAPPADLAALQAYPGPLVKGVTHKKSVVEYCESRVRAAGAEGGADVCGWALLWELLALLLRQNGVVVGSDIAELLMKNTKEFEYKPPSLKSSEYRGGSVGSNKDDEEEEAMPIETARIEEEVKKPAVDEKEALDRFREYLIFGNKQEALEWAMQCGLWGHALQLSAGGDRRVRAAVCARFVAALPATDPLHSLYAVLAQRAPPAATCVSDALWGDWRPHAAIMLSNPSAKPEQDRRNLTQLGDTLNTRGLLYSAQFCYLSAGVPFSVHPLSPHRVQRVPGALTATPPRLSLLLSDPRMTSLQRFATNHAIFATEIYEYALSLSQDYVLHELTAYKLVAGTRLADAGQCERALAYAEAAARALSRAPALYRASLAVAIAGFADRLKYYDPSLQEDVAEGVEGNEGGEDSPRHQQWLQDLHTVALQLSAEASQQNTPHHQADSYSAGSWAEQTLQHAQQVQQCPDPAEDTTDYSQYYQHHQQQVPQQQYQQHQEQQQQFQQQQQLQTVPEAGGEPPLEQYGYEEHARSYADPYWQGDTLYGYQDHNSGAEEVPAPTITMPGAPSSRPSRPAMFGDADERPPSASAGGADQNDRDTDTSKMNGKKGDGKNSDNKDKRSGWLGGILTKLSLRAPNQMILPDDTNPTIVWDEQHQRWRDTDTADSAVSGPPPPPPSGPAPAPGALPPALGTSTPLQSPGAPPVSNIFKMQKGRHIKKSYVDVLNPGGARLDAAAPPAPLAPLAPMVPPDNYFIPAPLPDQVVQVSISSTPEASPRPSDIPIPPYPPYQGGIYDPSQVTATGEEFRSGI